MRGNEIIMLDAEVTVVINTRAFRARLGNGHEFTAFIPQEKVTAPGWVCPLGARVRVRLSPYDLSCGEIVEVLENEVGR